MTMVRKENADVKISQGQDHAHQTCYNQWVTFLKREEEFTGLKKKEVKWMKAQIVEKSSMKKEDLEFIDKMVDLIIKCNTMLRWSNSKIFYQIFDKDS